MEKARYYFQILPVEKLRSEPSGMKQMSENEFQRLKESIQRVGILTPIHVLYKEDEDTYQILEGRHRYKAALELGINYVPCIIETVQHPSVVISHIFEAELIRKLYTPEEIEEYLNIAKEQEKIAIERVISALASEAIPKEILEKIIHSKDINSAIKLERLVKALDKYYETNTTDLKKQIEALKQELNQKKQTEKELLERLERAQNAIKETQQRFNQAVDERVEKRLQEEIAKIKHMVGTSNAEKLEELREEIRKEIEKQLMHEFKKKELELLNDIEELNSKLVDLSKKYKEDKEKLQAKEEELQILGQKIKRLENEKENFYRLQKQHFEKLKKISTFSTIRDRVDQLLRDFDTITNLIISYSAEGFEEEELSELKGKLKKVEEALEKMLEIVRQIRPYSEYQNETIEMSF